MLSNLRNNKVDLEIQSIYFLHDDIFPHLIEFANWLLANHIHDTLGFYK